METPNEKEEETISKQVELKKENTDTKKPEQLEYQIQPTTTVSQNPTTSQANEINSSHETAQMFEDQTSRITLNQPSTYASLTRDQRTETPNAENEKPREPHGEDYLFDSE
ncbi:hypothetical protein DPMN_189799 [Dreissena polymorpha]|uniref:Uncharacterized protein n=1 Tax=Dreissena polymorpha TaxID=45954 RepID=A0A9D4DT28_DREPO|nr:hypothetical protein DPMN_189799 [Dreissena polymorpha]